MQSNIETMEQSFIELSKNKVKMTERGVVIVEEKNGWYGVMTAHMSDMKALGTKIVTVFPENTSLNKPTTQGVISLTDVDTGELLCIMDGSLITGMRTGAVTGVATKYLSKKDSNSIGIFGSGYQSRFQLLAICSVRDINKIVLTSPSADKKSEYLKSLEKELNIPIIVTHNVEKVLQNDILVTATSSTSPLFDGNLVNPGTHINCIGAHTKESTEVDSVTLNRSKIIVDESQTAIREAGGISDANVFADLADIILGNKVARANEDDITLFKSMGLSLEDISTANLIYNEAIKQGLGNNINLS
jgi:ornithine cyclodeaminase/alanine dehydrogenase-like protein (mu-crystallin family)|tara:strand:+ start:2437 stop:3345 length:909 start_codon:yes stop_codon:yes gene_type:complete